MKVVVALDSFKGTLSARAACETVRRALLDVLPSCDIVLTPMADGGEGTADAILAARWGEWVIQTVTGPLPGRPVEAGFAWFADSREAVVEMASASGLTLLAPGELDPLVTTTYGTGELLRAAVRHGAERLWLAVGGSATVDGGVGAAQALGWRFLDDAGAEVGPGGGEMSRIAAVDASGAMTMPPVGVLCDVHNPLCGPRGAARVYGPQKGATPEKVEILEAGLARLADLVSRELGKGIADLPGAGAAGGLAGGAVAFMNAELVSGIDTVMEVSRFHEQLRGADWVITGEGRFDGQSMQGKVVDGICRAAKKAGVRVAVLAGSVEVPGDESRAHGIEVALATRPEGMPLDEALSKAEPLLYETAARLAGVLEK